MLILGTVNTAIQTVETGALINLGATYRKYCRKNCNGTPAFTNSGESVSLNHSGIYHITATFIGSGAVTGTAIIRMAINGTALPRAFTSETIATAETEEHTFVIDDYVLVDSNCVLGRPSTSPAVITFINSGIGTSYSLAKLNIDKVV